MTLLTIAPRDLPKLTTTTTTSSSSSTSASTTTSTSYTAIVTPPSASGNPNIWNNDHRPDGTVFIAVGSIVAAIIVALFVWWIVTNFISRRVARKTLYDNLEGQLRSSGGPTLAYDYGDDKEILLSLRSLPGSTEENVTKSNLLSHGVSSSKTNLRDSTSWDSLPEFQQNADSSTPVEKVNAIQDNFSNHYKRNSLFVSPIVEVIQQQQQQQQTNRSRARESENGPKMFLSSSMTPSTDELNKPERAASPERKQKKTPGNDYHKRNGSSLGLSPVASSVDQTKNANMDSSRNKRKEDRKKVPSMYLEDMLEGKDVA